MAQDDDSTPVYDFGDAGGVIVVDTSPSPMARGDYGQADAFWYYGPHPDGQGGWCPATDAHAHEYPPTDEYLFTQENGYYYFIGDPADFGYQGDAGLYYYYGAHPIAIAYGGGYCYYQGYHHHLWPAWGSFFVLSDGWYWYNGPFSPWYWAYRDRYDAYFRNVYPRRVTVGRPVTYAHPPAQHPRPGVQPVQRLRTPAAPARAGYTYVQPVRYNVVRPAMPARPAVAPRLSPAPVRTQPIHPVAPAHPAAPVMRAPVRAAPAGGGRRR